MTQYELGKIDWNEVAKNARLPDGSPAPAHLQKFITDMGPAVEKYAPQAGLPVNILMGQFAYESGMMHKGGQYNAFADRQTPLSERTANYAGLKGLPGDVLWKDGPTTPHWTYEYNGGKHAVQHPFRDYVAAHNQLKEKNPGAVVPSPQELFVRDYVTKLRYAERSPGDYRYNGVFGQTNPQDYARGLRDGGYYTEDPAKYAQRLESHANALMPGYNAPLPDRQTALAQAEQSFPDPRKNSSINYLLPPQSARSTRTVSAESTSNGSTSSDTASSGSSQATAPAITIQNPARYQQGMRAIINANPALKERTDSGVNSVIEKLSPEQQQVLRSKIEADSKELAKPGETGDKAHNLQYALRSLYTTGAISGNTPDLEGEDGKVTAANPEEAKQKGYVSYDNGKTYYDPSKAQYGEKTKAATQAAGEKLRSQTSEQAEQATAKIAEAVKAGQQSAAAAANQSAAEAAAPPSQTPGQSSDDQTAKQAQAADAEEDRVREQALAANGGGDMDPITAMIVAFFLGVLGGGTDQQMMARAQGFYQQFTGGGGGYAQHGSGHHRSGGRKRTANGAFGKEDAESPLPDFSDSSSTDVSSDDYKKIQALATDIRQKLANGQLDLAGVDDYIKKNGKDFSPIQQTLTFDYSMVGQHESNGANSGGIASLVQRHNGTDGQYWCSYYMDYGNDKFMPGLTDQGGVGMAKSHAAWAHRYGAWQPKGSDYVPKPGDLIIYARSGDYNPTSGSGHIGRVFAVAENGVVTSIEGNVDNKVDFRYHNVQNPKREVLGYVDVRTLAKNRNIDIGMKATPSAMEQQATEQQKQGTAPAPATSPYATPFQATHAQDAKFGLKNDDLKRELKRLGVADTAVIPGITHAIPKALETGDAQGGKGPIREIWTTLKEDTGSKGASHTTFLKTTVDTRSGEVIFRGIYGSGGSGRGAMMGTSIKDIDREGKFDPRTANMSVIGEVTNDWDQSKKRISTEAKGNDVNERYSGLNLNRRQSGYALPGSPGYTLNHGYGANMDNLDGQKEYENEKDGRRTEMVTHYSDDDKTAGCAGTDKATLTEEMRSREYTMAREQNSSVKPEDISRDAKGWKNLQAVHQAHENGQTPTVKGFEALPRANEISNVWNQNLLKQQEIAGGRAFITGKTATPPVPAPAQEQPSPQTGGRKAAAPAAVQTAQAGSKGTVIVDFGHYGAGHVGEVTGTAAGGLKETDVINRMIDGHGSWKGLVSHLQAQGYNVVDTRKTTQGRDGSLSLAERRAIQAQYPDAAYISVHADGGAGQSGARFITNTPGIDKKGVRRAPGPNDKAFAETLAAAARQNGVDLHGNGATPTGTTYESIGGRTAPSIYMEMGELAAKGGGTGLDFARFNDPEFYRRLGSSVGQGLDQWHGKQPNVPIASASDKMFKPSSYGVDNEPAAALQPALNSADNAATKNTNTVVAHDPKAESCACPDCCHATPEQLNTPLKLPTQAATNDTKPKNTQYPQALDKAVINSETAHLQLALDSSSIQWNQAPAGIQYTVASQQDPNKQMEIMRQQIELGAMLEEIKRQKENAGIIHTSMSDSANKSEKTGDGASPKAQAAKAASPARSSIQEVKSVASGDAKIHEAVQNIQTAKADEKAAGPNKSSSNQSIMA